MYIARCFRIVLVLISFITTSFAENTMQRSIASAHRRLGVALLQSDQSISNQVISPLSIHTALMLARMGAEGETAQELDVALLQGQAWGDTYLEAYRTLLAEIERAGDTCTSKVANSLWIDKKATFKEGFATKGKNFFSAPVQNIDFSKSEEARQTINNWVSEKTAKKIPELIPQGVLSPESLGALVNAVYFKASWQYQFDEASTMPESFYRAGQEEQEVPMMTSLEYLKWFEDEEWSALRLPYERGRYEMVIVLPKKILSVEALKASLSEELLAKVSDTAKSEHVIIKLPRFTVRKPVELRQQLAKLGIKRLFSAKAQLGGISEEAFAISNVLHEGFIEVNEHGTEAAAATAVMVAKSAAFEFTPKYFTADHPFIFMLNHTDSGAPLFMGIVDRP
jgi:serpin B